MFTRVLGAMLVLTSVGCAEPEELTANNFFRRERPTATSGTGGSAGAPTSSTAAGAGTSSSTAASSTAESSTVASSTAGTGGAGAGGAGNGGAGGRTSAAGGAAGAGTQTAGTGGASGSGGATAGAGGSGSGGAVADAAVDRITPPTMGISLLYKTDTGAMADSIQAEITINNVGPDTIPLSELTVRYFLTDEIKNAMPTVNINYGSREGPSGYLEIKDLITKRIAPAPNPVATADTMVELGFPAGAGSLARSDKAKFLMKYSGTMFPMMNQTNDYSFDVTKNTPTLWDKIVILRGGNVIWGTPP